MAKHKIIQLILVPVDGVERTDVEMVMGLIGHEAYFQEQFPKSSIRFMSLIEFSNACNNEEIDLNNYWVTWAWIAL